MSGVEEAAFATERVPSSPATRAARSAHARARHPHAPLREQIAKAALIQRRMLPDVSMPIGDFNLAALYRPRESLGGDFYDLAWQGDAAVVLVADVVGHGLGAALITMLVKAAFQEASSEAAEPAALFAGMDRRLQRTIPERTFVAAAVARLERHGAGTQVANAGLPHPLVVRASDRRVEELAVDGLGSIAKRTGQCFEDARLRQTLTRLAGGDGPPRCVSTVRKRSNRHAPSRPAAH